MTVACLEYVIDESLPRMPATRMALGLHISGHAPASRALITAAPTTEQSDDGPCTCSAIHTQHPNCQVFWYG